MAKINLTKVQIPDIEGNISEENMCKQFGDMIFNNAQDIVEHELSIKLYHATGEVELNADELKAVKKYADAINLYRVRKAVQEAIID